MNKSEHSFSDESKSRGCVLIVDDNDRVRQMLSLAFRTAGFSVTVAGTPQQVQRYLVDTRPDALVLNLQRSVADGLDMLRGMRARHDLSQMPIVFLAGSDSDDLRSQATRAGADWFGLRPLTMAELQKHISRLIRHGRSPLKLSATCTSPMHAPCLKPTGLTNHDVRQLAGHDDDPLHTGADRVLLDFR